MEGALIPQKAVLGLDPTILEYTLVDVEPGADHTVGVSATSKGGLGPMVIARPVNVAAGGWGGGWGWCIRGGFEKSNGGLLAHLLAELHVSYKENGI